jgi:CubicO group peptidase (beta-lactamase class C family)
MARNRIQRSLLGGAIVLGGALAAALIAVVALGIPRNAAGMAAKSVCSGAFVAGRAWQNLLADDVLPASPALAPIGIQVDPATKSVTARFAGLFARKAQWFADRGCVLDLEPAAPRSSARPPSSTDLQLPWPQGEAALPPGQWGPGVDAAALQKLAQDSFVGAGDPLAANARAVAIVHRGRMLLLRTAPGFDPATPLHGWSMTKTVAGMLGYKIALDTGLALDTPVVDAFGPQRPQPRWVAAWRNDARKSITVADLFYMRDGLANTEDYDPWGSVPRMLWGSPDAPAFAAAARPEAPAGTRWRYLSQTANLLAAVDRARLPSDADYQAYPARALFDPIGARSAVLESDSAGNWVASAYLWASVGDWARLGQLMLADGRWGTQQVLPPGWLKFAATPATALGEGTGYGAHTWRIGDPQHGECKGHGLPADTLAMVGHWGQIVAMVPSREAVIVRLGWTFRRGQFDSCAFLAAALQALPH